MNVTVQETLIEGMRQLDEYNRLREELPGLGSRVGVSAPLIPPLRDLKASELDVLALWVASCPTKLPREAHSSFLRTHAFG